MQHVYLILTTFSFLLGTTCLLIFKNFSCLHDYLDKNVGKTLNNETIKGKLQFLGAKTTQLFQKSKYFIIEHFKFPILRPESGLSLSYMVIITMILSYLHVYLALHVY